MRGVRARQTAAAFLLLPGLCFAAAANFLSDVPFGARPMGMGEAFTAYPSDPAVMWWNPAGLSELSGEYLFNMRRKQFDLVPTDTFLYSKRLGESYGVGLAYVRRTFDAGLGNLGTKGWKEQYGSLGAGLRVLEDPSLSVGLNLRYGTQETDGWKATHFAADLGLLSRISERLTVGIAARDLLARASTSTGASETYDLHLAVGFALRADELTVLSVDMVDFFDAADRPLEIRMGLERWLDETIAVRFGYIASSQDELSRFTAGASLVLGPWSIDYAFDPDPGPIANEALKLSFTYRVRR